MKLWNSYASEHSSNLVMIGYFKAVDDAESVKDIYDAIANAAREDYRVGSIASEGQSDRFSERLRRVLSTNEIYGLSPEELAQFSYDINYHVKGDRIVITTDENEISAFLKILIERGARVEVFSAHDHPELER